MGMKGGKPQSRFPTIPDHDPQQRKLPRCLPPPAPGLAGRGTPIGCLGLMRAVIFCLRCQRVASHVSESRTEGLVRSIEAAEANHGQPAGGESGHQYRGTRGIGKGIATAFVTEGAKVVSSPAEISLQALPWKMKLRKNARFMPVNVAEEIEVAKMVKASVRLFWRD